MIRVQEENFDIASELAKLTGGRTDIGAIVTFSGIVRDHLKGGEITQMTLEHYPGMTEKELERIEKEACDRWPLQACLIIHRYGTLKPGENIVLVITASEHRHAAFEAAEYLMDFLKTHAPFWKWEAGPDGSQWIDARESDDAAVRRWGKKQAAE